MEFILEIICLKKIKNMACLINLDEYPDVGIHWMALNASNNVVYFKSFVVEHIPEEIKKLLKIIT